MASQEDKENERRRQKQEQHEPETAKRLRKLEDELRSKQLPVHQPSRHQPEISREGQYKKLVLAGKFAALVVATIVLVKLATTLVTVIIVGGLAWFGYKLFFDSKNTK